MTLAENELCDVRSLSGIIKYAKHPVVSNSQRLLEIIPGAKYPEGHLRRRGIEFYKLIVM
jgi:hypothetical protein